MKKHGRLLLFILTALFSALFFAMSTSAEIVTNHFEYTYKDSTIVNNDWTFDTETGLLFIKSSSGGDWNECGTGQKSYDKYGGWSKYNSQIKKVVLEGTFHKISNNAFKGCANLEEIVITTSVSQIDHNAFNGCRSLHTVSVDKYIRIEGMADLRNIPKMDKAILKDTNIKTLFSSNSKNAAILEESLPSSLVEIYGTKGSVFEAYALENNIKFSEREANINIDVFCEGKIFNSFSFPFGMRLEDFVISGNGSAICLFEDEECKKAFDYTANITKSTKIYAKEILSFDGWSVRTSDYKGLRAVFTYNTSVFENEDAFEIIKVGAIAGKSEYALNDFVFESKEAKVISVYENGKKTGSTLGPAENGKVKFAISAIGFEGSEEETLSRALENIVFRGFIIMKDKRSGKEFTYYTDAVGSTLAYVSSKFIGNDLSEKEKAFVLETVDLTKGKGEDVRYDKDTLMEILTEIYNDNGKLLVGEEIGVGQTAGYVRDRYIKASGESPSIIGMDLACYGAQLMTTTESYRTEFLKALIDYCRDGGIITASSHFQNPTGNWTSGGLCRGYLGKEEMWEDLLTEGTALNRAFKRELNVDAAFLRDLGNNDIPILWRPFHEMNGNWFWWCIRQENSYLVEGRNFHEMWKYVYRYYEDEIGLTNLIWVYSPNNDTGSLIDVEYCYPGDEYVDMTGLDWYTSGGFEIGSDEGAYLRMMDYGMPTALTEYGSSGKLDSIRTWEDIQKMYDRGMKLTYVLTWMGTHSFPDNGKADELMAKPDVLSSKEVWQMFKNKE